MITYQTPENSRYVLTIPYFKQLALNLCWFYIPFAMVVIVGASNAVNLSDGLDGLASGLLIAAFVFFMIVAYICGSGIVQNFYITAIPQAAEIAVVCAAVIGACLGFCGLTPLRLRCLWEIPDLWHWALCWERLRLW